MKKDNGIEEDKLNQYDSITEKMTSSDIDLISARLSQNDEFNLGLAKDGTSSISDMLLQNSQVMEKAFGVGSALDSMSVALTENTSILSKISEGVFSSWSDKLFQSRQVMEKALGIGSALDSMSVALTENTSILSKISEGVFSSWSDKLFQSSQVMEKALGIGSALDSMSVVLAENTSMLSKISEGVFSSWPDTLFQSSQAMEKALGIGSALDSMSVQLAGNTSFFSKISEGILSSWSDKLFQSSQVMEKALGIGSALDSMSVVLAENTSMLSKISEGVFSSWPDTLFQSSQAMEKALGIGSALDSMSVQLAGNTSFFSKISEGILSSWSDKLSQNSLVMERLSDSFEALSDTIGIKDIDFENFDVDLYGSETVEEAKVLVKDTFDVTNDESELNWQQSLKNKCEEFSNKNPVYAFLIKGLITYIVVNCIIANIFTGVGTIIRSEFNKIANYSSNFDIRSAKNEITKIINNNYSEFKQILNLYRYINKENVFIRNSPSMKANRAICLNKGDIVQLVYKGNYKQRCKRWLYVEYTDGNENCYCGWINNIYTRRIAKF